MDHDPYPEKAPANEAIVDAFVKQVAALAVALDRADVSRSTPPELRLFLDHVGDVEDALVDVLAAVDAANAVS